MRLKRLEAPNPAKISKNRTAKTASQTQLDWFKCSLLLLEVWRQKDRGQHISLSSARCVTGKPDKLTQVTLLLHRLLNSVARTKMKSHICSSCGSPQGPSSLLTLLWASSLLLFLLYLGNIPMAQSHNQRLPNHQDSASLNTATQSIPVVGLRITKCFPFFTGRTGACLNFCDLSFIPWKMRFKIFTATNGHWVMKIITFT